MHIYLPCACIVYHTHLILVSLYQLYSGWLPVADKESVCGECSVLDEGTSDSAEGL